MVGVAVDGDVEPDAGFVDGFAVAEIVYVISGEPRRLDVIVVEIAGGGVEILMRIEETRVKRSLRE